MKAIVIVVGLILTVSSDEAQAGPIALQTSANSTLAPGDYHFDGLGDLLSPLTNLTLTSSASNQSVGQYVTADLQTSATANLRVVNGSVKMGAEAESFGQTKIVGGDAGANLSQDNGRAFAIVKASDQLRVVNAPAKGSLALNFSIDGLLTTNTSGATYFENDASALATFSVATDTRTNVLELSGESFTYYTGDETGPFSGAFGPVWTVVVPYADAAANISLSLQSVASTQDNCLGHVNAVRICGESAASLFAHTFSLDFIQVLDPSGQVVPGGFALGESGITYNNVALAADPVLVPEPGSLLLLATGLMARTVRMRRRRN